VPYHGQRVAAAKAVSGLAGVRGVRDEIELACDVDPADVRWQVKAGHDDHGGRPGGEDAKI
jgi:hypothetical protein